MKSAVPRIISNDDGFYPLSRSFYEKGAFPAPARRFQEVLMEYHQNPMADTIFHCVGYNVFTINIASGERYGDQLPEDLTTVSESPRLPASIRDAILQMRRLWKEGTDDLRLCVEGGHRVGKKVFASIRMNDTHFLGDDCYFEWCKFNQDNPQFNIAGPRTAFDFAHPEVRAWRLAHIREVCSKYDIDGIELDFWRMPKYFKDPSSGLPIFTDYMRQIRTTIDQCAATRGRPIVLACRTPMNLAECRSIGIDLKAWLDGKLLDMLVLGPGYLTNDLPIEDAIAAAHANGIKTYLCLNYSRLEAVVWGFAANAYAKGVDGLYFFNFLLPKSLAIGDSPHRKTKLYHADTGAATAFGTHLAALDRAPLPVKMTGQPANVNIRVSDEVVDLAAARITLRLALAGTKGALEVHLNGRPLLSAARSYHSADHEALKVYEAKKTGNSWSDLRTPTHVFDVPKGGLVKGLNAVQVISPAGSELQSLQIFVDYAHVAKENK